MKSLGCFFGVFFLCMPMFFYTMQPDDVGPPSRKFSRSSQRKKRRPYDSMDVNIKRLSKGYEYSVIIEQPDGQILGAEEIKKTIQMEKARRRRSSIRRCDSIDANRRRFSQEYEKKETFSSVQETIVVEKKRKRRLTSKRPARRNTVPNENTTQNDIKKVMETGLASHLLETVIYSDKQVSYRGSSPRRVHFENQKPKTSSEEFLAHCDEGTLDTVTRGDSGKCKYFVKQLWRRSDPSGRKKKIQQESTLIPFNYTGNYEKNGRRYSSVVNAIDKKKRMVAAVLRKLLLVLQEPLQVFLTVYSEEIILQNELKLKMQLKKISEYEKDYHIDQFMKKKRDQEIYNEQMMQKINALIFLYARNIYHHNYLRDFEIFTTCNCFENYDGCPDDCPKNEYVTQYVQDLFTHTEYLEAIRGKHINPDSLQWD